MFSAKHIPVVLVSKKFHFFIFFRHLNFALPTRAGLESEGNPIQTEGFSLHQGEGGIHSASLSLLKAGVGEMETSFIVFGDYYWSKTRLFRINQEV